MWYIYVVYMCGIYVVKKTAGAGNKKKQLALPIGSKVLVKGKNKGVVKFVGTTKK